MKERPEQAVPKPHQGLYWKAWEALQFDRQYGASGGQSPISYMAISQYARDNFIAGENFAIFQAMLAALDAEWLDYINERNAKEAEDK